MLLLTNKSSSDKANRFKNHVLRLKLTMLATISDSYPYHQIVSKPSTFDVPPYSLLVVGVDSGTVMCVLPKSIMFGIDRAVPMMKLKSGFRLHHASAHALPSGPNRGERGNFSPRFCSLRRSELSSLRIGEIPALLAMCKPGTVRQRSRICP